VVRCGCAGISSVAQSNPPDVFRDRNGGKQAWLPFNCASLDVMSQLKIKTEGLYPLSGR
jgi:hypothetical protein